MLVLGIGNLLMGDEGIGVHAIRALERESLPDDVTLLDGGTGGFHLLELFSDHRHMILIDATLDDRDPGAVRVLHPKFAADFPRSLSAHDIGLRDLVESAVLLGPLPTMDLITISIAKIQSMRLEMSPEVEAAIPEVIATVRRLIGDHQARQATATLAAA